MAQGYYSQIEIKTIDGVKYIDKTLSLNISRDEAEEIRQRIQLQRAGYQELRIPTSKLVNIEVYPNKESGRFAVMVREVFAGLDFMDVVDDENFPMYLDKLLKDIYRPLLTATRDELVRVGIDPVLRNFVYDNKAGEFCYVDFLPPKVFYKGSYSQEVPELTDPDFYEVRVFCHNSRAGIVYATYINLVREFPQHLKYIAGRIEQFLAEIGEPELYKHIANSPLYRVHSIQEVRQIIADIKDWKRENYFLLREIANWILHQNPAWKDQHKALYKLTHHVTNPEDKEYGRLSQKSFDQVLAQLNSALDQL